MNDELLSSTKKNSLQEFKPQKNTFKTYTSDDKKMGSNKGGKGIELNLANNDKLDQEFESF